MPVVVTTSGRRRRERRVFKSLIRAYALVFEFFLSLSFSLSLFLSLFLFLFLCLSFSSIFRLSTCSLSPACIRAIQIAGEFAPRVSSLTEIVADERFRVRSLFSSLSLFPSCPLRRHRSHLYVRTIREVVRTKRVTNRGRLRSFSARGATTAKISRTFEQVQRVQHPPPPVLSPSSARDLPVCRCSMVIARRVTTSGWASTLRIVRHRKYRRSHELVSRRIRSGREIIRRSGRRAVHP